MLTNEPVPRDEPGDWSDFWPFATRIEGLLPPVAPAPGKLFLDVLHARRSSVGGPVDLREISDLLWHAMAPVSLGVGRAGMVVEHRPYPTAGGLQCVRVLLVDSHSGLVGFYEPNGHRLRVVEAQHAVLANDADVESLVGRRGGCSLRFVGDLAKARAAYEHPETLLLREAGGLSATVGLCAEWLGLESCQLGSLGTRVLDSLGLPPDHFAGLGGIQITARNPSAALCE